MLVFLSSLLVNEAEQKYKRNKFEVLSLLLFYFLLPSFWMTTSSEYLIPFPLYGSGFLFDRMIAAKLPTADLS